MLIPAISVVMACYYGDKLCSLIEAVESVINQSISFSEFIIVVDGPVNAEVREYLQNIEIEFENIYLIILDNNTGAAHARNTGMLAASGDYIAIMDSDDILLPHRLEAQLDALVIHNVDAVWGWQEEFYDGTNQYAGIKKCPEMHNQIIKKLKYRCLLPDPTTFIKRECFLKTGGYAEFSDINIDYKFFLKLVMKGFHLHCVQETLIRVRVSPVQRMRRGGVGLLKQDILLRIWMHRKGFINLFEMSFILFVYAIFRLQPNFLRDKVYKYILRRE